MFHLQLLLKGFPGATVWVPAVEMFAVKRSGSHRRIVDETLVFVTVIRWAVVWVGVVVQVILRGGA